MTRPLPFRRAQASLSRFVALFHSKPVDPLPPQDRHFVDHRAQSGENAASAGIYAGNGSGL
jgi:hypothetical protein